MMGSFASRICGSSDLYRNSGKGPACSVNFITCHDGFTLNDLVSYNEKHNMRMASSVATEPIPTTATTAGWKDQARILMSSACAIA